MNETSKKKRNTVLFMVVAVIVNIVLMTIFMLAGWILLSLYGQSHPDASLDFWLILVFIGSVILAWVIYALLVKWYTKRVDVNEKFAPLITPKQRKRRPTGSDESEMKR